jgi:cyclophilin family peptidyl-prolyl cis-trans isomerase
VNGSTDNRSRLIFVGIIVVGAIVALGIVLLGGGEDDKDSGSTGATASCSEDASGPGDIKLSCPDLSEPPADGATATVETSEGEFTIALATEEAPATSGSFIYQVENDVFKDNSFTRIAPGFVIQGGDPSGTGAGNAGFTVVEPPPEDEDYPVGTVAMAKSGTDPPGASGSQFFVVIGTASPLPPEYALLGRVSEGMDVVNKIAAVSTESGSDGPPARPIAIDGVKINPPAAAG